MMKQRWIWSLPSWFLLAGCHSQLAPVPGKSFIYFADFALEMFSSDLHLVLSRCVLCRLLTSWNFFGSNPLYWLAGSIEEGKNYWCWFHEPMPHKPEEDWTSSILCGVSLHSTCNWQVFGSLLCNIWWHLWMTFSHFPPACLLVSLKPKMLFMCMNWYTNWHTQFMVSGKSEIWNVLMAWARSSSWSRKYDACTTKRLIQALLHIK